MKDKLLVGVMWLGSAKVIINVLGLFSTFILAKLLTPEDFGLVAIVLALLAIVESVTDLSISSALIHKQNPTEDHFHTAWTLNLIRASIILVVFVFASSFVAEFYKDPRLVELMYVIGFSIFISGFSNPKIVTFTKSLIFKQEFAVSVIQKVSAIIISLVIAYVFKSYWALVAGLVISQLVSVIYGYTIVRFKPKFTLVFFKDLWAFSIWLTLSRVVNTLNWKFDHLLIGSSLGNKTLGFYTVGDNLAGIPTREAIQPLESILFPGYTQIGADRSRLKRAYIRAQSLITAFALPLGIGFALISEPFIFLFLGEKWLPAVEVIQVIACIYVTQTLGSQVQPLAMALGKTKILLKRDLFGLIIRVSMILYALSHWGLMGVVWARAIAGTIFLFINMYLISQMLKLSVLEQLRGNLRSLISVILMAAFVLLTFNSSITSTSIFDLFAQIVLAASVYILSCLLMWVISGKPEGPESELIKILNSILKKIKS